jgi:hypothetical protein
LWTLLAGAAAAAAIWVTTAWLLDAASTAQPGADRSKVRIDAVRTGLAAGAGVGATIGLMLAVRRQRHQEIATVLADFDATERRITELYLQAANQLGNEKAPVRLAGLYALERLAQDNPAHRQTIVNLICAYLRMPFRPESPPPTPEPELAALPAGERASVAAVDAAAASDWSQERQVRLTAQRILADHLRPGGGRGGLGGEGAAGGLPGSTRFWSDIRLDLTGATLMEFDLSGARVGEATFYEATFADNAGASFDDVTFAGVANFACAQFHIGGYFRGASFLEGVYFGDTSFDVAADFVAATFVGDVRFEGATFTRDARFDGEGFTRKAVNLTRAREGPHPALDVAAGLGSRTGRAGWLAPPGP